jgi:hypothetical protein
MFLLGNSFLYLLVQRLRRKGPRDRLHLLLERPFLHQSGYQVRSPRQERYVAVHWTRV